MFKVEQINTPKSYVKMSILLIIIAILASIASLNLVTSIILNLVVPFFIIFLTTAEKKESNYFIYGYEYIMLQSYPIHIIQIPQRIAAVIITLLLGYIFMRIYNRKKKIDKNLVCDGELVLYNIKNFKKILKRKNPRFRFAIRTSFILWITCIFMDRIPDRNIRSYWLPLITYGCLEIDHQKQQSKGRNRRDSHRVYRLTVYFYRKYGTRMNKTSQFVLGIAQENKQTHHLNPPTGRAGTSPDYRRIYNQHPSKRHPIIIIISRKTGRAVYRNHLK